MSIEFSTLANHGLHDLQPYQPGKPIDELKRELGLEHIIKMASNENPLGCSPKARQAAIDAIDNIALYPDGASYTLKEALSQHLKINSTQLTVGTGSEQLIALLIQCFVHPNQEVLMSQYGFAIYYIASKAHYAQPVFASAKDWGHDINAMTEQLSPKTQMVFIANPNNPTGTYITQAKLCDFLDTLPAHILCVIDEAYFEYAYHISNYPDSLALQNQYPNLVILRTFSKAYGLAGLRVGYCISHPDIADILNRARLTFNVNTVAQAAATAALGDQDFIQRTLKANQTGKTQLLAVCEQLKLKSIPSVGNFLTIDLDRDSTSVYNALLKQGIIVRPLQPYGMPQHIRVTIGLEEDNNSFINTLSAIYLGISHD